ncbi:MAG: gp436 family protein [Stenotrophomonas sp.]|uniref:gp436 family protein n=1 Tax=Stenotrophomonas sp. TaxID=69392 RepID=UPI003D6CCFA5
MYCTPTHLAAAKLARELAQVATPERHRIVADDLMEATLRSEDRSQFDPDDILVADEALAVIATALVDADGVIDGYLVMRKPVAYKVPLNPVPGIVSTWARWIARYLLHKDRVNTQERTDPVVRDYQQAIEFLELTRDGKFSLGMDDPLPPAGGGSPEWCAPDRQFSGHTLRDYGE